MMRMAWCRVFPALLLAWFSVPGTPVLGAELASIEQAEAVSKTTGRPILALAGSKS